MAKKSTKLLIGSVLIIALLVMTIVAFNASQQSALSTSKYIEAPTFGFLKCLPINKLATPDYTFGAEFVTVSCSEDSEGNTLLGMNDGCTVTLTAPDKLAFERRTYAYKKYQANGVLTAEQEISGGIGGYSGEIKQIQLSGDEYLVLAYGGAFFGSLKSEGQKYSVTGNPFAIHNVNDRSATNGQQLTNTRTGNCFLENNEFKGLQIDYHSPEIEELENAELDFASLNKPYGVYTYFKGFTPVPSFDSKVENYNGIQSYCMDNKMFKILQISVDGFTYNIVNYEKSGFIGSVTCCNGDERPAYICDDHQWIKQEDAVCDISQGKFCPQSTFQPFGDNEYKRFVCEDNQCVADVITVECNDDSDCSSGEVCIRQSNPRDNYCAEGGSGGIEPPRPPSSCSPTWEIAGKTIVPSFDPDCTDFPSPIKVGIALIGAVLAFALSFRYLPFEKKSEKRLKIGLSVILATIIGLLAWFYWVAIVVTLVILIILVIIIKVIV